MLLRDCLHLNRVYPSPGGPTRAVELLPQLEEKLLIAIEKWNKILVCDKKKKPKNSFFLLRVSFLGLIAFMSARGQNDIQVISFPTSLSWEAFCSIFPILLPSSYFEAEKNKKSGLLSLESWVVKSHLKIQRRRPSPLLPSLSSSSSLPPPPLFEADTIHCFAPIRKAPRELSQGISYLKEPRRPNPKRIRIFSKKKFWQINNF